jgi:exodeoxyribonuclease V alpha subunit
VLGDLIESGVVPVVALKHIFRQAEDSAIITNAHRVNRGELPVLDGSPGRDFYFLERRSPEEVLATIKLLVGTRIPRALQIDPVREIQVLTPMHRGLLGSAALNAELQAMLTPPGPELRRGSSSFRVGDKVIQLRNDYELDVSNGDIGQVVEVDPAERELVVSFDGRPIRYEHDALDALALAFACSIHKAQGSEFPAVVVPIHTQHFVMLRRNLLYTALTRGKRMVVLVGEPRALRIAVEARRVERRASSLGERLVRSRPKPAN